MNTSISNQNLFVDCWTFLCDFLDAILWWTIWSIYSIFDLTAFQGNLIVAIPDTPEMLPFVVSLVHYQWAFGFDCVGHCMCLPITCKPFAKCLDVSFMTTWQKHNNCLLWHVKCAFIVLKLFLNGTYLWICSSLDVPEMSTDILFVASWFYFPWV